MGGSAGEISLRGDRSTSLFGVRSLVADERRGLAKVLRQCRLLHRCFDVSSKWNERKTAHRMIPHSCSHSAEARRSRRASRGKASKAAAELGYSWISAYFQFHGIFKQA